MWENFKKTPFYDEGAMWMGKGRWILPVPGTRDKKMTLAAKVGIIVACVVGVAFFVLSFWLGRPDYTYKKLPHYEMLYDMMGRPITDVAPAVGVKPDELIELSDGTYKLPQGEVYAGIAFETVLHFENEMLSGFTYTAEGPAEAKEAAKDIANVAEMFKINWFELPDGTRLTVSGLRRHLEESNELFSVEEKTIFASRDQSLQDALSVYLHKLENDPNWEGRVGAYLTKGARFSYLIELRYDPDTQWVSIQIKYNVVAVKL